ncbi:hypothetical protein [Taibaiella koreensis]|uniref:hypothetical protein n=1 Tax=Taibaiella koreensis TaxID=1268548 RepID=UPI000E59C041|nr:hypothetical protein [Taibaiella koreensis]
MNYLFRSGIITIICICFFSCKEKSGSNAVQKPQPATFAARSGFDLSRIAFDEDATHLFGTTLDTADHDDWPEKHFDVFREKDSFARGELPEHVFVWKEKRYYFRTQTLDSIACYANIFFYQVGIETDEQFHPLAIVAKTKFREKKDLDSMLVYLSHKLGKTTEEQAIKADNEAQIDTMRARGMAAEQIAFMSDRDTTSDLLNYGDNNYFEWRLSDRYIQVSLSKDREIVISTNAAENRNEEYYYADLLFIKKEVYEGIEARQYQRSVKSGGQQEELRPYALRRLDPMENWRLMARLEAAWKKR